MAEGAATREEEPRLPSGSIQHDGQEAAATFDALVGVTSEKLHATDQCKRGRQQQQNVPQLCTQQHGRPSSVSNRLMLRLASG